METATVESFIALQREALATKLSETQKRLERAQSELDDLDRELRAIDTYEKARAGRPAKGTPQRHTSKRDQLLALIRDTGAMGRADIIDKAGVKGDKAGEQAISNALSALKNQKKLTQDQDGRYLAA